MATNDVNNKVTHIKKLLLPRDRVTIGGILHGDTAVQCIGRFISLFREAWRDIPQRDRRIIRKHIADGYVKLTENKCDSDLQLHSSDVHHGFATYQDSPLVHARPQFTFWLTLLDALPDDLVKNMIVHELGHAWCRAWNAASTLEDIYAFEDAECIGVQEHWGYDEDAFQYYLREHCDELPKVCDHDEDESPAQAKLVCIAENRKEAIPCS